jgi:hypothetical protein
MLRSSISTSKWSLTDSVALGTELAPTKTHGPPLRKKGFLDPCHYNFANSEKHHYYSSNWKLATTILQLPHLCPILRLPRSRAHWQAYTSCILAVWTFLPPSPTVNAPLSPVPNGRLVIPPHLISSPPVSARLPFSPLLVAVLRRRPLQLEEMQFRRGAAGSSSSPTVGAASSSPTGWGQNQGGVCPFCRVQLVRIRSKQRETYGQMFVKCPYSVKVSEFVLNFESPLPPQVPVC